MKSQIKEIYICPDIVVVEIEIEQSILYSGSGDGDAPDLPPVDW